MILAALLLACPVPDAVTDDTGWSEPACPRSVVVGSDGDVASDVIDEASGLAVSRHDPSVLWTHNDSGDTATVYAIGTDGAYLGAWPLDSGAVDWEDLSWGTDEGGSPVLYAADMGDNDRQRPDITLYRIPEPDPAEPATVSEPDVLVYSYPDGPHDAETLLFDPIEREIVVLAKSFDGPDGLYRAGLDGGELQAAGSLDFGTNPLRGSGTPTGGDVSGDGLWVIVVTYTHAFLWPRDPARPLHTAFELDPCEVPREGEAQGEAVALSEDGLTYFTVSEGTGPAVNRYELEF